MKTPKILLLALLFCSKGIAQSTDNETYRFQISAFSGLSFNAGSSYLPQYFTSSYTTQTFYNASEQPALCRGGSVMVFPTFMRWKRFCITAGIGWVEMNTAINADSVVSESSFAFIPRTVMKNWRGQMTERFVQFPILIRIWLFRRQRFVFHSDAGIVFSSLLSGSYPTQITDSYRKGLFGTSFYSASINTSYRIIGNSKFGMFVTAGITSQLAVSATQFERKPGWWGGLFAIRLDAY
jgi:hypothetical protein